jgi:hypothetical protein
MKWNGFWRNGIMLMLACGSSLLDIAVAIEWIRARWVPMHEMITHRLSLVETGFGFPIGCQR